MKANAFRKFLLLLWKNWVIQSRHKVKTVVEILLPVLLSCIFLLIRYGSASQQHEERFYEPFQVNSIEATPEPDEIRGNRSNSYNDDKHISWPVAYYPDDVFTRDIMTKVGKKLHIITEGLGFDDEDEMVEFINEGGVDKNLSYVLGGVVFGFLDGNPDKLQITIRLPFHPRGSYGLSTWRTKTFYPVYDKPGPRYDEDDPEYLKNGFLALEHAISQAITEERAPDDKKDTNIDVEMQQFPYPSYTDDTAIDVLKEILASIIMFAFIYPAVDITKSLVQEKENRLKESMKMMGLSNWLHWTAWFVKSLLLLLLPIFVIPLLLCANLLPGEDPAVLGNSSYGILFLFLLLFIITSICLTFLISVLFSKARTAATVAGLFWYFSSFLYTYTKNHYTELTRAEKMSSCLLHMNGMSIGFQIIIMHELAGTGNHLHTFTQYASLDDNISLCDVCGMFIVDALLYMLLALYIEAVFPGEYGVPQPWYFPVTKHYWCPWKIQREMDSKVDRSQVDKTLFEEEPSLDVGIQIQGLSKVYKKGKPAAVENMDLNIYQGQITALLGHNGAGKTTTMSILTGLFPSTTGTAIVNGYDINVNMDSVRESMGLCPQHDVLFPELTVEEHLYFFCKLKGMESDKVKGEIDKYISALQLEDKRHKQAHTLSGGMKRKLCVVVALCGGSKIVMLDEPTSGMDPQARRSTWDLLLDERADRTMLLTTHFMEEADLLGDRIAIMAQGKVQCCGSSFFLKKKFGAGYHLVLVKEAGCNVENVTIMLKKHAPNVELDQIVGAEITYVLPEENSDNFPAMFTEMDEKKDDLGISSYGLCHTTMEEVFIKVGQKADEKLKHKLEAMTEKYDKNRLKVENNLSVSDCDSSPGTRQSKTPSTENLLSALGKSYKSPTLHQQFVSQIFKRFLYTIRSWKTSLGQVLGPMLFIMFTVYLIKSSPMAQTKSPPLEMTLDSYTDPWSIVVTRGDSEVVKALAKSYRSVIHKELQFSSHWQHNFSDTYLSLASEDTGYFDRNVLTGVEIEDEGDKIKVKAWFNYKGYHIRPLALALLDTAIFRLVMNNSEASISFVNHPLPLPDVEVGDVDSPDIAIGMSVGINMVLVVSFLVATFARNVVRERVSRGKHIQLIAGLHYGMYWISTFLWDFLWFLICCIPMLIAIGIYEIEGLSDPPQLGRFFLLFLFYGFASLPLIYVLSFLFTSPATATSVISIINLLAGIGTMIGLMVVQGMGKKHLETFLDSVFLLIPNYCLGIGYNEFFMKYFELKACRHLSNVVCENGEQNCCSDLEYFHIKRPGAGRILLALTATFVLMWMLICLIEEKIFLKLWLKILKLRYRTRRSDMEMNSMDDDNDVGNERRRILNSSVTSLQTQDRLILRNLTKYYGRHCAVNDLCLGVSEEECFGLLGVNGAGKTSTFKMLTGDESITEGDAYVLGYSCAREIKKVHKKIGYCPQFDAIIEDLTGYENIQLFSRIHGVREDAISSLCLNVAENLNFEEHLHKLSRTYSGGNKRKLSAALALVGNPDIVFLDEPTTGMDPLTKRLFWDVISNMRASGKSVILTSHSMEECEALCTKLAIMVNGKFRCLGSCQHLKSKFGKGFTIIAKIGGKEQALQSQTSVDGNIPPDSARMRRQKSLKHRLATQEETGKVQAFIEHTFSGAILKECHEGMVTYQIDDPNLSWAQLFKQIEDNKDSLNIVDYTVGQTTLEQVFLGFAKMQLGAPNQTVC